VRDTRVSTAERAVSHVGGDDRQEEKRVIVLSLGGLNIEASRRM
jgi:hypothetical protein